MTEQEKLGYYYKQMQVVEQGLIESKSVWDMWRIVQLEVEKEKVQFAIKRLESLWFQPII